MEFYISATTDIGTTRSTNQDSLFVRKLKTRTGNMAFAVLSDGMGGYQFGEVASAAVVSAFTDWMYTELPVLSQSVLEDYIIREQWSDIIRQLNDNVYAFSRSHGCVTGATVTVLLLTENRYFLLNVGDTRAYELGESAIQLTEDHTVVAGEIRRGNMTEEQARNAPMENVLTKCIGIGERFEPDLFFGEVHGNVIYMLCSDGFRHCVTVGEMMSCLLEDGMPGGREMKLREEYLVELNKRRGERDNISVITIRTDRG